MENVVKPEMNLESACKVLKTGPDVSIHNFSKCYQIAMDVAMENNELTPELENNLAQAWRIGNQNDVSNQVEENKGFVLDIRFDDLDGVETCSACNGAGEKFKFTKKPVEVGCLKCKDVLINLKGKSLIIDHDTITYDGKDVSDDPTYKWYLGKVVENCISCKGTGRYVVEDKEHGGKNDLQCKTCRGKNVDGKSAATQIVTKCKTCKGKRRLKIMVISNHIKSTTICRKCSGKGFTKEAPKRQPFSPVMSAEVAKDISSGIKNL